MRPRPIELGAKLGPRPKASLVLEDGSVFRGTSIGIPGVAVGEVVFNTAMTGYQEILTDPSYARQLVTLTYPHIGNTGSNDADNESERVWADGLIIRDLSAVASSHRNQRTLPEFLYGNEVVAIADIDTRRLTRLVRDKGAQAGCIAAGQSVDEAAALAAAHDFPGLSGMDLAKVVTRTSSSHWNVGVWQPGERFAAGRTKRFRIVAYDFGVKRNILRLLVDRGCEVIVVPATTSADVAMQHQPDGIFLSNGPGDPEPCAYAITAIKEFLQHGIPTFGICLGYQLLALASGAQTEKMRHGHHGANHPVKEIQTGRVLITSQNHGFAVTLESLPANLCATHVSLFDQSLQGIHRTDVPAFGFQGHPEASPGPQDITALFDHFIALMADKQRSSSA